MLALVLAQFNADVMSAMRQAAHDAAREAGVDVVCEAAVPGCYEVPLVLQAVLRRKDVSVAVVLGYIERGQTLHGEVMGHVVHRAAVELSLAHGKPVGLGVIGPGATEAQAQARKVPYAKAAVKAALAQRAVLEGLNGAPRSTKGKAGSASARRRR